MNEEKINAGDTVVLKSGGPVMTVEWANYEVNEAYCVWFDGKKNAGQKFAITSLKKAEPN